MAEFWNKILKDIDLDPLGTDAHRSGLPPPAHPRHPDSCCWQDCPNDGEFPCIVCAQLICQVHAQRDQVSGDVYCLTHWIRNHPPPPMKPGGSWQ